MRLTEETVQRFMARLDADAAFRDRVQQDAASAFTEFGLSPAEQAALTGNDEDALRRLTGLDVSGYYLFPSAGCSLQFCVSHACASRNVGVLGPMPCIGPIRA
jgi:hypothetical protein